MLLPQFTIRWMLSLTALCAVVFAVFGMALRGETWAFGATMAVVVAAITFLLGAGAFGLIWIGTLLAPQRFTARPKPIPKPLPPPNAVVGASRKLPPEEEAAEPIFLD